MLTKDDKKWIDSRRDADRKWVGGKFGDNRKWIIDNFATKDDLSSVRIDLKSDMAKMEERIESKAQKRHNELMDLFDGLAKEVKDNEEFRLVVNHRLDRIQGVVG